MFENINVEDLVKRLTAQTDEIERKAQDAAEGVLTVSGKALYQAVHLADIQFDDVNYTIKNNALQMQAVDPSHTSMLQLRVGDGDIEDIHSTSDSMMGVRKLKDISKESKKHNKKHTDMITITENEEKLMIATPLGVRTVTSFKGQKPPKLPELEPKFVYEADYTDLSSALKACNMVGDLFTMKGIEDKELELSVQGSTDSVKATVGGTHLKSSPNPIISHYSGHYMKLFQRIPKDFSVKVSFSDNYPLTVEFEGVIADTPVKGVFLLAPRVDPGE